MSRILFCESERALYKMMWTTKVWIEDVFQLISWLRSGKELLKPNKGGRETEGDRGREEDRRREKEREIGRDRGRERERRRQKEREGKRNREREREREGEKGRERSLYYNHNKTPPHIERVSNPTHWSLVGRGCSFFTASRENISRTANLISASASFLVRRRFRME